jgi:NAD(P)-dependent dehydrogenase (short-subunit alcohol dehydrogenase family)
MLNSATEKPVAIVTGAGRGIGAATALELAAAGYRVNLCARTLSDCEGVAEQIRAAGGMAEATQCDVLDYAAMQQMTEAVLNRWQRVDVLVNNAGVMDPIARLTDCDPQDWANNIEINLIGVFNGVRAVLPIFQRNDSGVVINISSGAATNALVGWSAYCVAKAGVAMLTKSIALETADSNLRVYGLQPGMVNTALTREALKIKINRLAELDPEQFDDPARSAKAIRWLCSDAARSLAGQELTIDEVEAQCAP